MRYLTILFIFAFSLLGQRPPSHDEGTATQYPWGKNRFFFHAVHQVVDSQGHVISQTDAPNEWVNMVVTDDNEADGWHTHGSDADPRPSQIPFAEHPLNTAIGETPTRLLTDAHGMAVFAWRGNGFSGNVTTLLVADSLQFPIDKHHVYLSYWDFEQRGSGFSQQYLKPINALGIRSDLMDYGRHDDGRHLSVGGFPGNSRFAAINSAATFEILAKYYRTRHHLGLQLDLIRSSLPDGGCADNKMLAGGTTAYQYLTWKYKACNNVGVEFDIENPALQAGGVGTLEGNYSWNLFEHAAYDLLDCQAAKFFDDGLTKIPTAMLYGVNSYWYGQPVVRLVCSYAPFQKGH